MKNAAHTIMPKTIVAMLTLVCLMVTSSGIAQEADSTRRMSRYKNIIRYNLSGALLFGASHYIVFGYERLIKPNQSISLNIGKISFPRLISINTGSLELERDIKNTGTNFSVDYRFYLPRENKHIAPHGLYIGPYYS